MPIRSLILAAALLGPAASSAAGQAGKLFPADQAANSSDFFVFRAQLLAGLVRRDTAALLAAIAPDIRSSPGRDTGVAAYRSSPNAEGGVAEFRRLWQLDADAPRSPVWEELATVLTLGGGFEDDDVFVAPYVYHWFPPTADPAAYLVTIGANVPVREEPRDRAPKLQTLSFDIVAGAPTTPRPLTRAEAAAWQPVELRNRRVGYVDRRSIRSPLDYHAVFERRDGKWMMTALISGNRR